MLAVRMFYHSPTQESVFGRQCRKSFNKVEYTLTKVFTTYIDNESNMLKAFCILVMIKKKGIKMNIQGTWRKMKRMKKKVMWRRI